jgi:peptidoglycan hydrolase CwlO-like protein
MKTSIQLILILSFLASCSKGTKQKEEPDNNTKKESEKIEETIQKVDKSIQDSESKIEKTQNEIDSLLNGI